MMDRRKFKRRTANEGETPNRVLNDLEPGVSAPKPDRAQRVFARAKTSAASGASGDMHPDDIIARAKEQAEVKELRRVSVKVDPLKVDPEIAEKRRKIEELRRQKARLIAQREEREAKAKAEAEAQAEAQKEARLLELREIERRRIEEELAAEARHEAEELEKEQRLADLAAAEELAQQAEETPLEPEADWETGSKPALNDTLILDQDDHIEDYDDEDWDIEEEAETSEEEPAPLAASEDVVAPVIHSPETSEEVKGPWDKIRSFAVDERHLERNRLISAAREDLAHTAFDVLRTRLLHGLRKNGWSRVAITSPSKDCGKTFTAANLAMSLARQENCRTVVFDFDMRRPSLAKVFGANNVGSLGDMLRGEVEPEDHLRYMGTNSIAVGKNLAFGFNGKVEPYASELLQDNRTGDLLNDIQKRFDLDVMLFDMPPALYHDDVIAARHLFDAVLLVVGGGTTKASEIKDVERRIGKETPLLGTVLNFSEGPGITRYSY